MKTAQEILSYIQGWMYGIAPDKSQHDTLVALHMLEAYIKEESDHIEHPLCNEESRRRDIEYADNYSHQIWENLMKRNAGIGCNDVSDIVLNAILDTIDGRSYNQCKRMQEAIYDHMKKFDDLAYDDERGGFTGNTEGKESN